MYDLAEEVSETMQIVNASFPTSTQNIEKFSQEVDSDFDVLLNPSSFLDERKS